MHDKNTTAVDTTSNNCNENIDNINNDNIANETTNIKSYIDISIGNEVIKLLYEHTVGIKMTKPLYWHTTLSYGEFCRIYPYCMYKIIIIPGKYINI